MDLSNYVVFSQQAFKTNIIFMFPRSQNAYF